MKQQAHRNKDLHGNVPDHCPLALILLDVLNDLDFPGGDVLAECAPRLAKRNRWRSDSCGVLDHCLRPDVPGRVLAEPLTPLAEDYIVLKPKHSAFYATPLDTLLSYLGTKTILLVGLTTNACVLTTACEIRVRDLNLYIPSDCVAATDAKLHRIALELLAKSFDVRTTPASRLNLRRLLRALS